MTGPVIVNRRRLRVYEDARHQIHDATMEPHPPFPDGRWISILDLQLLGASSRREDVVLHMEVALSSISALLLHQRG